MPEDDIEQLKTAILSIDWEISDDTIEHFKTVLSRQLENFKSYKIHHAFLRIIYNLGNYVAVNKAKAHTDSISFLRHVFEDFEKIVRSPDLSLAQKREILEQDLQQFQSFKQKIATPPAAASESKAAPVVSPDTAPVAVQDISPKDQSQENQEDLTDSQDMGDAITPALSHLSPHDSDWTDDQIVRCRNFRKPCRTRLPTAPRVPRQLRVRRLKIHPPPNRMSWENCSKWRNHRQTPF